jgi:predicted MFS family arabinose efflux permease
MHIRETWRDRAVLMTAHVAGLIDLVALPLWMGILAQYYRQDLETAGAIVTSFLFSAVAASLFMAPHYLRLPRRTVAVAGFGLAAMAFWLTAAVTEPGVLMLLHALAGLSAGSALSMAHGTIGRGPNPHRLFAMAGAALGVAGVLFYAAVPKLAAAWGGQALFHALATAMTLAALACIRLPSFQSRVLAAATLEKIPRAAWFAIAGLVCLSLNQAVVFSMLERIGMLRGFGQHNVNGVLVACGVVNLLPAVLAGLLQHRLAATRVALWAPVFQAALAATITLSAHFVPYAVAASLYAFVMIFAHTFLFALIARLDGSGRAVAATPAMMLAGAAMGPLLAGLVATRIGVGGLALLAALVATVAVVMFAAVRRRMRMDASGAIPAASACQPARNWRAR